MDTGFPENATNKELERFPESTKVESALGDVVRNRRSALRRRHQTGGLNRMAVERIPSDIDAEVALKQSAQIAALDARENLAVETVQIAELVAVPQIGELLLDDAVEGFAQYAAADREETI